jgi:hypothetical protein
MSTEAKSEKIKLEGGPKHGKLVTRPDEQHVTIFMPITGKVWSEGQPTAEDKKGVAVYQYFEEHDCAFWAHNDWQ